MKSIIDTDKLVSYRSLYWEPKGPQPHVQRVLQEASRKLESDPAYHDWTEVRRQISEDVEKYLKTQRPFSELDRPREPPSPDHDYKKVAAGIRWPSDKEVDDYWQARKEKMNEKLRELRQAKKDEEKHNPAERVFEVFTSPRALPGSTTPTRHIRKMVTPDPDISESYEEIGVGQAAVREANTTAHIDPSQTVQPLQQPTSDMPEIEQEIQEQRGVTRDSRWSHIVKLKYKGASNGTKQFKQDSKTTRQPRQRFERARNTPLRRSGRISKLQNTRASKRST